MAAKGGPQDSQNGREIPGTAVLSGRIEHLADRPAGQDVGSLRRDPGGARDGQTRWRFCDVGDQRQRTLAVSVARQADRLRGSDRLPQTNVETSSATTLGRSDGPSSAAHVEDHPYLYQESAAIACVLPTQVFTRLES